MSGLSAKGFSAKTLDDILTSVKARLRTSFGKATETNVDAVVMVTLLPVLLELEELWQGARGQYDFLNKNNAEGITLDNLGAIVGIPRLSGAKSVVGVEVTGTEGAVISTGFIRSVQDTNEPFQTLVDYTLPAESSQPCLISMSAMNDGTVQCITGTLNQGSLPSGVTAMENPGDATLGSNDETDEEYRIGLGTRLAALGAGTVSAIKTALLTITDVTAVTVFVNDTGATDSEGLPPHSIRALVSCAYTPEINQAIWDSLGENKGAGTYTDGNQVGVYKDPIDGQEYPMRFSRIEPIRMYVKVVVTSTDDNFPVAGIADIKAAIIAEGATFKLDDDVTLPRLQRAVTSVHGIVSYTLYFKDSTPVGTEDATVVISKSEVAQFGITDTNDIDVT